MFVTSPSSSSCFFPFLPERETLLPDDDGVDALDDDGVNALDDDGVDALDDERLCKVFGVSSSSSDSNC